MIVSLYKNISVDFIGTGLQILDIPRDIFGFWEGNLCSKLPEAIRPRQMSQCCVQELSQECTRAAQQSELALSLEKSISLPSLPKLLLLLVGQKTKDDDLRMKFHPKLETFLNNFCTQSVKKLKNEYQTNFPLYLTDILVGPRSMFIFKPRMINSHSVLIHTYHPV